MSVVSVFAIITVIMPLHFELFRKPWSGIPCITLQLKVVLLNGRLDIQMTPRPGVVSGASSVSFLVKTAGNGSTVQDFIILCIWKIPSTLSSTKPQSVLNKLSKTYLLVKRSLLPLLGELQLFFVPIIMTLCHYWYKKNKEHVQK